MSESQPTSTSAHPMIFEWREDHLLPLLSPRYPADGVRFFTPEQAAAKFGKPADWYKREWLAVFAGIDLGPADPADADAAEADDDAERNKNGDATTTDESLHHAMQIAAIVDGATLTLIRRVRFPDITRDDDWNY